MIFSRWSLLVTVTKTLTHIKHTLKGGHIHFDKGKAHESNKSDKFESNKGN